MIDVLLYSSCFLLTYSGGQDDLLDSDIMNYDIISRETRAAGGGSVTVLTLVKDSR
jgi:hypothetical protein